MPVPKLRLELDREDDSLLFVPVHHECALDVLKKVILKNDFEKMILKKMILTVILKSDFEK